MTDLARVIEQAKLPSSNPDNLPWLPWPELTRVNTFVLRGTRHWVFLYNNGARKATTDPAEAELVCRHFFPDGPEKDNK